MTASKCMRRAGTVVLVSLLLLAACSAAESHGTYERFGEARISIEQAPADVSCVRIIAAGSTVSSRAFDVSPGASTVFALSGLPLGSVAFSGEAFPSACVAVADGTAPHWLADAVSATLEPGVVAEVALTMRRNGSAAVAVDFETEGQGGTPGSAGAAGAGSAAPAPSGALVFSEYVEGSSTYKGLEISALADTNLEGCRVAFYYNGATTATAVNLAGMLPAGDTHVLCSTSLSGVSSACDQVAGLTFNGDDAIVLECDANVIDAIGQVGFDPGTAWGAGELSLLDHTLRRKCQVLTGDFDPAARSTRAASGLLTPWTPSRTSACGRARSWP